jgi:hypothetical protein
MFAIVATPFTALQDLPAPEFKLMVAVLRYVNRLGECWPALRQLAADIQKSEATASRMMARLAARGCFDKRERAGNGRYFYQVAARFLPRWPGKAPRLTDMQDGPAQRARQEAKPSKHERGFDNFGVSGEDWPVRMRGWRHPQPGRQPFWLASWGARPGEAGCRVPVELLTM